MDYCSYAGAVDVTVILHSLASIVSVTAVRSVSCARGEGYEGSNRLRVLRNRERCIC